MFTGIVEATGILRGRIESGAGARVEIDTPLAAGSQVGESIAVAGVCLTLTDIRPDGFSADLMRETMLASTLGQLQLGGPVNLERAMPATGRLDGHIVTGHVDALTRLLRRDQGDGWDDFTFALPQDLVPFVAHKGSITIDGVSLTVTDAGRDSFGVSLIPTTLRATTLGGLAPGDAVNIEIDVIARYVHRMLSARPSIIDSERSTL